MDVKLTSIDCFHLVAKYIRSSWLQTLGTRNVTHCIIILLEYVNELEVNVCVVYTANYARNTGLMVCTPLYYFDVACQSPLWDCSPTGNPV